MEKMSEVSVHLGLKTFLGQIGQSVLKRGPSQAYPKVKLIDIASYLAKIFDNLALHVPYYGPKILNLTL